MDIMQMLENIIISAIWCFVTNICAWTGVALLFGGGV